MPRNIFFKIQTLCYCSAYKIEILEKQTFGVFKLLPYLEWFGNGGDCYLALFEAVGDSLKFFQKETYIMYNSLSLVI